MRSRFEEEVVDLLPDLYASALRLAGNEADAEDLVAEAVAKAWEKLPSLEEPSRFRGWIFRILTNEFLGRRRARKVRGTRIPLEEDGTEPEASFSLFERLHQPFLLWWGSSPEKEFLDRLLREDLERAVDALPEAFRVVVVLADVQGLTYREIAETLDLPIGTVRSRLARARSRLQETLWSHAVDRGLAGPAGEGPGTSTERRSTAEVE